MANQIGLHRDDRGGWLGSGFAGPPHPQAMIDKVNQRYWQAEMDEKRNLRADEHEFLRGEVRDQNGWMNDPMVEPEIPQELKNQATWLGILLGFLVLLVYGMVYGLSLLVL